MRLMNVELLANCGIFDIQRGGKPQIKCLIPLSFQLHLIDITTTNV